MGCGGLGNLSRSEQSTLTTFSSWSSWDSQGSSLAAADVATTSQDIGVPVLSKRSSDYEIAFDFLGRATTGHVVSAVEKATQKEVAIKTFRLDRLSRKCRQDMLREIRTQALVDHPCVAKLEGVYSSPSHMCLVIERLIGGSLLDALRREGPLRESRAASAVEQLLHAVGHLHERGLVHRDVNLKNFMFESRRRDRLKLIDFGVCKPWEEGMEPMTRICGTTGCMAPELAKRSYTNKVDLWSVGVAAHELLTGELPFVDKAGRLVVSQSLSSLSPEAESFVAALLTVAQLASEPRPRGSADVAICDH